MTVWVESPPCASLLTLPLSGLIMPQNTLETVNELIAGSFGGAAQVLVGQPLDTVKTRAQIAPSSDSFFYVTGSLPHHAQIVPQRACLSVVMLTLFPLDSLTMPQRKDPWIYWVKRYERRAFWHFTKVRLSLHPHPIASPD